MPPLTRPLGRTPVHRRPQGWAALAVATVLALVTAPTAALAASATVNATTTAGFGAVLTDAQGFALYTLPTDHNGMSTCTGSCPSVWPALTVASGTSPTAGPGVNGTVAAVLQSNGTDEVTYNGDPLYTFVGDSSAGQVTGNNVGGFNVALVSAATPSTTVATTAPSPGTTSSTTPAGVTSPSTSVAATAGTPATQTPATAAPGPASAAAANAPTASGAVSGSPSTLAVTGPGPALLWMVVVGAGLLGVSVLVLLALGDTARPGRRAVAGALRAGTWILGR
jgi:predicted lipoprotein with Yx(FWY)xxD motif